jgi:hypothetical protein
MDPGDVHALRNLIFLLLEQGPFGIFFGFAFSLLGHRCASGEQCTADDAQQEP